MALGGAAFCMLLDGHCRPGGLGRQRTHEKGQSGRAVRSQGILFTRSWKRGLLLVLWRRGSFEGAGARAIQAAYRRRSQGKRQARDLAWEVEVIFNRDFFLPL